MRERSTFVRPLVVLLVMAATAAPAFAQLAPLCPIDENGRVANVFYERTAIFWEPIVDHERLRLSVLTPCGTIAKVFERGETPFFDLKEVAGEVDGQYSWELRVDPVVDASVRKALDTARAEGDMSTPLELQGKGLLPKGPLVDSAGFSVFRGEILDPASGKEESGAKSTFVQSGLVPSRANGDGFALASDDLAGESAPLTRATAAATVLTNADGVIRNSLCVGFDCANNESFGFDTIRLKENNTRIQFDDTSVGSFPTGNWQIRANSSASGGQSFLGFVDQGATGTSETGTIVFLVEAGAGANALRVDDSGRVGFGTANPVLELHVSSGDTPALRLEQNTSSGFAAQTWDVAGNETNFFVRDATGGSTLPFRIAPGANSSTLSVLANGLIGLGTFSSGSAAELRTTSGSLLIVDGDFTVREDDDGNNAAVLGASATRGTLELQASGGTTTALNLPGGTSYIEGELGLAGCQDPDHDLIIGGTGAGCNTGTFSEIDAGEVQFDISSSRSIKQNLVPVEVENILERIEGVDVYTYDFIDGKTDRIGLMAEDFHQIFGRGSDKMLSGHEVQLALWLAVQELAEQNTELRRELDALKASR